MKRVSVAVGVIIKPDQEILIARRSLDQHQGGLWEFPGGKIEQGEETPTALARELEEELGVMTSAEAMTPLLVIEHDYSDKKVTLDVWIVNLDEQTASQAHGAEGQEIQWVDFSDLEEFEFPAANVAIVESLRDRLPTL